jgi:hypothetical protein
VTEIENFQKLMHLNQFSHQKHTHAHVWVILPQLPEIENFQKLMHVSPIFPPKHMYARV